jgi:hypothetical protein
VGKYGTAVQATDNVGKYGTAVQATDNVGKYGTAVQATDANITRQVSIADYKKHIQNMLY